ncbi:MAG: VOC family protein [Halobacteriovoraceae bacterium]|nr:VOC family protein [Halobacteriovoraceae bacterium]
MAKIIGIGGVFIESANHKKLNDWYIDILGIPANENKVGEFHRSQDSGENAFSVFSIYKPEDEYFKPSKSSYMINFKVEGLDKLLSDLKTKGVKVYPKIEEESYGRFAWIEDPDGNKVELWEPSK